MTTPPTETPFNPRLRFDDGAAYEQMMGRWSALVAAPFLDWLALPQGLEWLDDGCGNGSFTELLVTRQRPALVVGVDAAPAQLAFARQRPGTAGVSFVEGDAQALPLPDAGFDAAVIALVLFFLPSPVQGLQEMVRTARPGGQRPNRLQVLLEGPQRPQVTGRPRHNHELPTFGGDSNPCFLPRR